MKCIHCGGDVHPTNEVERIWAQTAEDAVRKALPKKYQGRPFEKTFEIMSTTKRSIAGDWLKRNPFEVWVITEGIDPYRYRDVHQMFNRAAEKLRKNPWYDDAGWESYRTGLSYFWLKPKLIG